MKNRMNNKYRIGLSAAIVCACVCGIALAPWALAGSQADQTSTRKREKATGPKEKVMQVQYLEIVTKDVDIVCNAYTKLNGVPFSEPDIRLGNARTAKLPGGSLLGVRAPMREDEDPVVRPYWLVDDIEAAVAAAIKAGGELAHPPFEIPGHGTFAIYIQGGIEHGLWEK